MGKHEIVAQPKNEIVVYQPRWAMTAGAMVTLRWTPQAVSSGRGAVV